MTIAILTNAASRDESQVEKPPKERVESHFVTTVGTHNLFDGKVTVRVYEEKGKLNYRVIRTWRDLKGGSVPHSQ